ncbi:MAG: heavy metal translocating P-type ATPase [Anaerolineales bacterium]
MVTTTPCALCELPAVHTLTDEAGHAFCCPACREVYGLIAAEDATAQIVDSGSPTAARPGAAGSQRSAVISLSGLWCASCAWLVGETLRRAPGVTSADFSYVQQQARVEYDPARARPQQLVRRVRRLGYRAWLPGDTPYGEEDAHLNRMIAGGAIAMKIMVISLILYARDALGLSGPDTAWLEGFFHIMLFILTVPVLLLLGLPILRAGVAGLLRRRPNMHTLIALGAFSAFGLSARNLVLGIDRVYFDTAAMLLLLVNIGHWLEMRARNAGNEAAERLQQRMPREAARLTPEGEVIVPIDALPVGARVRVRPGERFPVDGVVAVGAGDVDESLLTGESQPVTRRAGDHVRAGTVSMDGAFEVVAAAVGSATVAGQIGRLLHQAQWQRAPLERLADRLAAIMTPAAVAIAVGTFAFWTVRVGPEVGLLHALSVLLIACPCALGLATPLTLWLGVGRAAEAGVLLRNTGALEQLAAVRRVYFDKTGTLTQRPFRVLDVATDGLARDEFLARVASVEVHSEHPLARAVAAAAQERGLAMSAVDDFSARPGEGVSAQVQGETVWIGHDRFMRSQGQAVSAALQAAASAWRARGRLVIFAGWRGRVRGIVGLGERVRAEAVAALAELHGQGLAVELLTGDDPVAGERWARRLGVPVHAGLTPAAKLERLRAAPQAIAMVGDGINDGPVLAAATVGIALSDGTDVAQAAADVILLRDDLRAVPSSIRLARAAMARVRENLAWAFVYNTVGVALAVSGVLQPVLAALAMVASSAFVTWNAARLRKVSLFSELERTSQAPSPDGRAGPSAAPGEFADSFLSV